MDGRTSFMIAHRLSTIRHADLILVIDRRPRRRAGNARGAARARRPLPAAARRADAPAAALVPRRRRARSVGAGEATMTRGRPKIVLLGMMTKIPVAGVVWQTLHYLLGFERLGYEPYYVEAHARTPSMLMRDADDDSGALAAAFIATRMRALRPRRPLGLPGAARRRPLLRDERAASCERLYASAELIINLHGGTEPLPEHYATGRLVYLETDPVQLQVELHEERQYDARLPRAALRLLHVRRELRAARTAACRCRSASTSTRRASRSSSTSGSAAARTRASSRRSATGASRGATSPTTASATAGARTTSSASSSTCPRARAALRAGARELRRRRTASCSRAAAGACATRSTSPPTSTPTATTSAARAASSRSPRTRTCGCGPAGSATAAPPTSPPAGP